MPFYLDLPDVLGGDPGLATGGICAMFSGEVKYARAWKSPKEIIDVQDCLALEFGDRLRGMLVQFEGIYLSKPEAIKGVLAISECHGFWHRWTLSVGAIWCPPEECPWTTWAPAVGGRGSREQVNAVLDADKWLSAMARKHPKAFKHRHVRDAFWIANWRARRASLEAVAAKLAGRRQPSATGTSGAVLADPERRTDKVARTGRRSR